MEKEKQLLKLCCLHIEQSLLWGDSAAWTNDDFERLSEKIFEKTRIQLSISTLKRIWGKVRYENFPTTATLNALAGFLGYESWREFRQKNDNTTITDIQPKVIPAEPSPARPSRINKSKMYLRSGALVGVIVIILAMFFVTGQRKPAPVDPSKIKFSASKMSDTLPNSVVFNYDASVFNSDSVFIQQSWDPQRRERVDPHGRQHTSIYYNPGYFIAKLIVNNEIKKEYVVNIQTHGWKGIIEKAPIPTYLSPAESRADGHMGITTDEMFKKTGSPVFNNVWVKFANVREFKDIDANNFTFDTHLRNTSAVEASVCRRVNAIVLLKGGAIILPLCDKGCISNIGLLAGMHGIDGRDHDLSSFGCDFSNFQDLKCVVANNDLKAYLNGRQAIDIPNLGKLGDIEGIRFEFEGAGEVKNVHLATPGAGAFDQVW